MESQFSDRTDWAPTASLANLHARAALLRRLRFFFESKGFLEVETPLISGDSVVDRFLEPIRLPADRLGVAGLLHSEFFLQTSPEYAMKRLLAAGMGSIFQICKAFRSGEVGERHNPEFTMLEWYDPQADYQRGLSLLSELANEFLPRGNCRQTGYSEAFSARIVGPKGTPLSPLTASNDDLRWAAEQYAAADPASNRDSDRDNLLNLIWGTVVEPELGLANPVVVYDWPPGQSALAKTRWTQDGLVAERFELYFQGIELANGYHELVDACELFDRSKQANQIRLADGRGSLPVDSRLLQAMRTSPSLGTGVALGVDRLLMAMLGAKSISEVLAFPIQRA